MSIAKPSNRSERALLLSPEPPAPAVGGGALRSASILHFLAQRFEVHLVTFRDAGGSDGNVPPQPPARTATVVALPYHAKGRIARARRGTSRLLRNTLPLTDRFCGANSFRQVQSAIRGLRFELAVIEHFWCAPYIHLLRPQANKVVLDLHNIESVLHARCARSEPWPQSMAHRLFSRVAARMERDCLAEFDLVLTASEADRRRVLDSCPAARVEVVPNTLPETPEPDEPEEHVIAFSGNLEYHPNVTAVRHFRDNVWPRLRKADPELRWRLIGKNERGVRRWIGGDERIELTGPVSDAIRALARAKVVVAPLLSGSGTRVKILEAWAASRAVVSTRLGAEGLPAEDGVNIRLVDEPAAMADNIQGLLADPGAREQLGRGGRAAFERSGSWPTAWRALQRTALAGTPETFAGTHSRCDNGV